jgi:hypothetical protein
MGGNLKSPLSQHVDLFDMVLLGWGTLECSCQDTLLHPCVSPWVDVLVGKRDTSTERSLWCSLNALCGMPDET